MSTVSVLVQVRSQSLWATALLRTAFLLAAVFGGLIFQIIFNMLNTYENIDKAVSQIAYMFKEFYLLLIQLHQKQQNIWHCLLSVLAHIRISNCVRKFLQSTYPHQKFRNFPPETKMCGSVSKVQNSFRRLPSSVSHHTHSSGECNQVFCFGNKKRAEGQFVQLHLVRLVVKLHGRIPHRTVVQSTLHDFGLQQSGKDIVFTLTYEWGDFYNVHTAEWETQSPWVVFEHHLTHTGKRHGRCLSGHIYSLPQVFLRKNKLKRDRDILPSTAQSRQNASDLQQLHGFAYATVPSYTTGYERSNSFRVHKRHPNQFIGLPAKQHTAFACISEENNRQNSCRHTNARRY